MFIIILFLLGSVSLFAFTYFIFLCPFYFFPYPASLLAFFLPSVATQAVHFLGIPKVARSWLTECSKSCDLQPSLYFAICEAQGILPFVGWVV